MIIKKVSLLLSQSPNFKNLFKSWGANTMKETERQTSQEFCFPISTVYIKKDNISISKMAMPIILTYFNKWWPPLSINTF